MVVDACSARIGAWPGLRQRNACLGALLSSSRARAAQKCAQTRVPSPQCHADTNPRGLCVNHRMVADA
eukprot:9778884-Lingulodinium_polyedra.AAC.1